MNASRLYRAAGALAVVCALLLTVNTARRAGVLPENGLTHAIAPFAPLTGLFAISALYLWQRAESGTLGLIGYALNAAGLAGAFAIEYALHFVFPYLEDSTVDGLVEGATGRAFAVTGVVLITGVALFGVASWRAGRLPAAAVALYVVGMIPGSLRNVVPTAVFLIGLIVAAAGIAWMGLSLRSRNAGDRGVPHAALTT